MSGLSLNNLAEICLKKIGFIFQSYNLIEVLAALENIEYVLLLQGMDPRPAGKNPWTF